ncbi:MAG: ABC transporter permease [Anaerolineales bacterium]
MLKRIDRSNKQRQREGSPWSGLGAVLTKELADHLTGARMRILELLILVTAAGTVYTALQNLGAKADEFLYLRLFTAAQEPLPSFVGFLGFLVPIIAIALAFDAVNSEFNRRTLSRILAQPVYRDAFLFGKFLSCLLTLTVVFSAIWLLIFGLGILRLGVPPTGEETGRALIFLLATIFYGGIWAALALLFSVVFRSPATAALSSLAVWLFFTVFWDIIAGLLVPVLGPHQISSLTDMVTLSELELSLARISPITLYGEIAVTLLQPAVRSLGIVLPIQLDRAVLGAPLPLDQSLLLIWPHLTGLIAVTLLLFALGYVIFQRQEIRA